METRNEKGAIFNLSNNFGWKNKTETDLNLDAKDLEINFLKVELDVYINKIGAEN
jgi:hypothetical protein